MKIKRNNIYIKYRKIEKKRVKKIIIINLNLILIRQGNLNLLS